jgi:hypothetical protein
MTGYVQIWKFCELTGYTEKAVRAKIQTGVWLQNRVWRKAPDGRILISVEGYRDWVETGMVNKKEDGETESEKHQNRRTKSPLPPDLRAAGPSSSNSPLPARARANRKEKDGQR